MTSEGFKDIKLQGCAICNRFFVRNHWSIFPDLKTAVISFAKDKIKLGKSVDYDLIPFISKIKKIKGKHDFNIRLTIHGDKEEVFVLPARVTYSQCDICAKAKSQYYEAILQLRDVSKDLIEETKKEISKLGKKGVFVNKIIFLGKNPVTGVDFYISSKAAAKTIGKQLQEKYGGELNISAKIFSRSKETSKDLYRISVLYRTIGFKKGETITYKGENFKVVAAGKKIQIINEKGKKMSLTAKEIKHYVNRSK